MSIIEGESKSQLNERFVPCPELELCFCIYEEEKSREDDSEAEIFKIGIPQGFTINTELNKEFTSISNARSYIDDLKRAAREFFS